MWVGGRQLILDVRNMANEVKKLYEMGIITPQTLFYLAKKNEKPPVKAMTVEQEPRTPLEFIGTLRVNEFGDIVRPPMEPEEPDTSNWKRMTAKRQMILSQYRKDLADYEVAMAKWLELTPINDAEPHPPKIIHSDEVAVFEFPCGKWVRGQGNIRRELPSDVVEHHEMEVIEFQPGEWWIQQLFGGNASNDRRRYKRNRDLDMDTEYDTDIQTGEQRQLTLFNCPTSAPRIRNVNEGIIQSFVDKPNNYLSKAFMEHVFGDGELTDWQRFQLRRRAHYVGML